MGNKNRTTGRQAAIECATVTAALFAVSFAMPYIIIFLYTLLKG